MRRHHLRSLSFAIVLAVCALTLVVGVAFSAGPSKAVANGTSSPFANVDNVILFIGDGMGPNHVQVGRMLNGGTLTHPTASHGAVSARSTRRRSTASRTRLPPARRWRQGRRHGTTGSRWDPDLTVQRPSSRPPWSTPRSVGKATGLITDLELSDATPAVFAAHVPDRDLGEDITRQMAAHDIEFLASGGWSESSLLFDPAYPQPDVTVTSLSQLNPYLDNGGWPNKMYGIFGKTTLAYTIDREEEGVLKKQPTLPQLTQAAIGVLNPDPDGFFVMIEDGSNDWGGHSRDAAWVGAEIRELDQAVKLAYDWAVKEKAATGHETLIILEADHETGGLIVGPSTKYPLIAKQTASTEWMWGLIKAGKMSITKTLSTYAGFTPTSAQIAQIQRDHEMGISDVLAARYLLSWGWSGTDEGDHTATEVPVKAWGPGSSMFAIDGDDNEVSGQLLLEAVSQ